ncbi:MAG: hypothetical protein GY696_26050, partial [Gammaproteobacteria bacterium]|nr:hypothetical protein [Gammaproteobacteria bacterium]
PKDLIFHDFPISDGYNFYPMTLLVDPGVNTSLMSVESYQKWFSRIPLQKMTGMVKAVDRWEMESVMGTFAAAIQFGHKTARSNFVVNQRSSDFLGMNFLKPLGVQVDCGTLLVFTATVSEDDFLQKFPNLLKDDLGTFSGTPHSITLEPEVQPVADRLRRRSPGPQS